MLSHCFTPRRQAAWERQQQRKASQAAYATLTRWIAALVGLVLLGTLLAKVYAGPLALPGWPPAAYQKPASPLLYESDSLDL